VFITKQGKINFVDLAGSEMTKKTMSEGKTLEEANNINKSLMVLGKYARARVCGIYKYNYYQRANTTRREFNRNLPKIVAKLDVSNIG